MPRLSQSGCRPAHWQSNGQLDAGRRARRPQTCLGDINEIAKRQCAANSAPGVGEPCGPGRPCRGGDWGEIDDTRWNVPAAHMKSGVARTIPLSTAAVALLDSTRPVGDSVRHADLWRSLARGVTA